MNNTSTTKSWDFLAAYCRHRGYRPSPDLFREFYQRGEVLLASLASTPNMIKLGNAILSHYNSKLYDAETWCIQHFKVVSVTMLLKNGKRLHVKWA